MQTSVFTDRCGSMVNVPAEGAGRTEYEFPIMSIQRAAFVALLACFGATPALAQSSPLDLNKVTRVSSRTAAAPPPLPPNTYSSEEYNAVAPNTGPANF